MLDGTASRAPTERRQCKPGRLRAACTSCHAAKVRCSGEKAGCTRCRTLGHECVYLESRVGKTRCRRKRDQPSLGVRAEPAAEAPVPGNENRTLRAEVPNTGDSLGGSVLSPANSSGTSEHLNHDIWAASQSLSDEAILGTMSELPTLDFWLDYPDGDSAVLENAPSPTPKEMNVERQAPQPPLDSPINLSDVHPLSPTQQPMRAAEYRMKPASLAQNEVNRPRTSSFPDKQTPPMTRESKGVVVAAAEIVQQLEEMMCAGLSAIDEVLRVNKEATRKITDLISRTDYDSSFGSSIVVVAAAHHVVCLFENACCVLYPSCSSGNQQSMSSRKTQDNSIAFGYSRRRLLGGTVGCGNELLPTPGIGFGSFRMDPQEQAALCAQIISTELHRSLRMVQSLSMPIQIGCFGLDPAGVAVDGWLQDLKQRLRSLISAVERSEQLWPR